MKLSLLARAVPALVAVFFLTACVREAQPQTEATAPTQAEAPSQAAEGEGIIWIGDSADSPNSYVPTNQMATQRLEETQGIFVLELAAPGSQLAAYDNNRLLVAMNILCGPFVEDYGTCPSVRGVVVQMGLNDFNNPTTVWSAYRDALGRIFEWARSRREKVLMLDLIWAQDLEDNDRHPTMDITFSTFRAWRQRECAANRDVCRMAVRPAIFNRAQPELFHDALHPNAAGQEQRYRWISQAGEGYLW
jgi:hypothetical protein